MIHVETAVRAFVLPSRRRRPNKRRGWRSQRFGDRVLVFDTETTTDFALRLLFGVFRLYESGQLVREGIFTGDSIMPKETETITAFATERNLELLTREDFVERVFYPEVYGLGTLCVGFNLKFDLSRMAVKARCGKGRNRRRFRLLLSHRVGLPYVEIEPVAARTAFLRFTPRYKLREWEKPFFSGRLLDLATLASALTGEVHSLRSAACTFQTEHRKSRTESLGTVTPETLAYGYNDVLVTAELYEKLRDEFLGYPFATIENEAEQASNTVPYTRIHSGASLAKAVLRAMGIRPLLGPMMKWSNRLLGIAMASYFGGRAEVRIRKVDVPVRVLDFTSMYPTVFILMGLQRLLTHKLRQRVVTIETREFLATVTAETLFDPSLWPQLRRFVRVRPSNDVVPVRQRPGSSSNPYTITVTNFTSDRPYWYTLGDIVASKLYTGKAPVIEKAVEVYADEPIDGLRPIQLTGLTLDADRQIFKTVVEERQRAKGADPNSELGRRNLQLKNLGNSGCYGIHAEINVTPAPATGAVHGTWYSDVFGEADVRDERPGEFFNPVIAALDTGGARLMLALLEREVTERGGVFAFCDTDSLAIVAGRDAPPNVKCLDDKAIEEIIGTFDQLSPYDPDAVPHLLKLEHKDIPNLRCFAIAAKRYALYTLDQRRQRLQSITEASESALGALVGRSKGETTRKLARRIWRAILTQELGLRTPRRQRSRLERLLDFNVPLRRKLPISTPSLLRHRGFKEYNRTRSYDFQVKPFSFLQAATVTSYLGEEVLPVAPMEFDLRKARKVPWTDFGTGKPVKLDWDGTAYAGTVPVMTLAEYVEGYARHPESKAADAEGNPAGEDTRGFLGRLHLTSGAPTHIGKEIDRLDEVEQTTLEDELPIAYDERDELAWAIEIVASMPRKDAARELGVSVRRLQDIIKGRVKRVHRKTREAIIRVSSGLRV
jgi:hypothetical protein